MYTGEGTCAGCARKRFRYGGLCHACLADLIHGYRGQTLCECGRDKGLQDLQCTFCEALDDTSRTGQRLNQTRPLLIAELRVVGVATLKELAARTGQDTRTVWRSLKTLLLRGRVYRFIDGCCCEGTGCSCPFKYGLTEGGRMLGGLKKKGVRSAGVRFIPIGKDVSPKTCVICKGATTRKHFCYGCENFVCDDHAHAEGAHGLDEHT